MLYHFWSPEVSFLLEFPLKATFYPEINWVELCCPYFQAVNHASHITPNEILREVPSNVDVPFIWSRKCHGQFTFPAWDAGQLSTAEYTFSISSVDGNLDRPLLFTSSHALLLIHGQYQSMDAPMTWNFFAWHEREGFHKTCRRLSLENADAKMGRGKVQKF